MVGDDVYEETCQQVKYWRDRTMAAEARLCDQCDGSGQYFIDDEPQVCICVGEKKPYQKLMKKVEENTRLSGEVVKAAELIRSEEITGMEAALGEPRCDCDPSVGMAPCMDCTLRQGLVRLRRVFEAVERMKKKVEGGGGYSQEELSDMESSCAPARKKGT